MVFIYDENDSPIGIQFRKTSYAEGDFDYYFFEKNLQGDVIAIYNADGEKIGTYTYDAWGRVTLSILTTNSSERNILTNNPFRYRSYYYDTDTCFYYLQSRYYNPWWCRFLNRDDISVLSATPHQLTDKNLYA